MIRSLFVGAMVLGLAAPAVAQDEELVEDPNNPGVVYKKKTEYDFEGDMVEGSFVRPEGEYLDARRSGRHSSLFRIRENFLPEMLKSAEDI